MVVPPDDDGDDMATGDDDEVVFHGLAVIVVRLQLKKVTSTCIVVRHSCIIHGCPPRMTTATIWRLMMMMKLYSMALHWNALPRCRCSFFPGLPVVYVPILLYRISFCVILATSYPPSLFGLCLVLSLFTRFVRPLFLSQLEPSCPVL